MRHRCAVDVDFDGAFAARMRRPVLDAFDVLDATKDWIS